MKKVFNKRIMAILMMAIVIFTLVGCNSTNTNVPTTEYGNVGDESASTEAITDNVVVATPEPTDENYINSDTLNREERDVVHDDGVFWFSETSVSSKVNIDTSGLVPFENVELININTNGEIIDVYNEMGIYVGYLKDETRMYYVSANEDWSKIATTYHQNEIFVNTEILDNVIVRPILEPTPNPITTPDVDVTPEPVVTPEPTPTPINVVEMSATKYAIQSVNIRKGPGTEYDKVGGLTTNQAVTVTGKTDNGWFRFDFNGADAYVSGKYLADTKVVIPTPAPVAPGPAQTQAPATTPSEGQEAELVLPDGSTIIVVLPTPIPQSERISWDVIMAKLEAAMYAAGYKKPADVCTPEEIAEFGPTIGMGWGIATIDNTSEAKVDEYVAEAVSVMSIGGWNMFYLEYVGVNPNNGWCDIKVYRGTWY